MAEFVMDISKPNGRIHQIGDNDSGRFFKLDPAYEKLTVAEAKKKYAHLDGYDELPEDADGFVENSLDCSHLVAAASGLFERSDFVSWLSGRKESHPSPDYLMIRALSGCRSIGSQRFSQRLEEDSEHFRSAYGEIRRRSSCGGRTDPQTPMTTAEFPLRPAIMHQDLVLRAYPDFGLYIYASPRLFLAVRAWGGRLPLGAAHIHGDQLAVELNVDGIDLLADPGTYVYTPLPAKRLAYRHAAAHGAIMADEGLDHDRGRIFHFPLPAPVSIVEFNERTFSAYCRSRKGVLRRTLRLEQDKVVILDAGIEPPAKGNAAIGFSPGYGMICKG
jgi:hypothetical protein